MYKSEIKEKPKYLRVLRLVSATTCILVLSLLFFLLVIFFTYLIVKSKKVAEDQEVRVYYVYRAYHTNPKTNSSSVSFTTLPTKLENDEFLSYASEDGNYVLISKIGVDNDYKCTGTCYCYDEAAYWYKLDEDPVETKTPDAVEASETDETPDEASYWYTPDEDTVEEASETPDPVKTSETPDLFYLLVAGSTIEAKNLAMKHYEEECHSRFDSVCPSGAIRSEVDECEKLVFSKETGKKYLTCKGNCVDSSFEIYGSVVKLALQKVEFGYGCEKLSLQMEISVRPTTDLATVKEDFTEISLDQYCHHNSVVDLQLGDDSDVNDRLWGSISVCMGYDSSGINPSVECLDEW